MKRVFIFLALLFMCQPLHAKTITRLEFFFDADPGYDAGIEIPITPAESIELDYTIDLTGISDGFHVLYIRAKDDEDKWSLNLIRPFFKTGSQSDIVKMEYFLDDDPGEGQGTDVPITPGQDVAVDVEVDLASVEPGHHILYFRSQDDEGKWTMRHAQPVFVINNGPNPEIVKVEYFFNSDPGPGNATDVPIASGENIAEDFLADLRGLDPGNYQLGIRAQDQFGNWSLTFQKTVYKYVIAYYPYNGDATDQSGMGNEAEIFGATLAPDVYGNTASAYRFNGIDDYMDVSTALDDIDLSSNTVMMWIQPDESLGRHTGQAPAPDVWPPPDARVLFAAGEQWLIYYHRGALTCAATTAGGVQTLNYKTDLAAGQWRHVALVYSRNGEMVLYMDGLPVARTAIPDEPIDPGTEPLTVAGTSGVNGRAADLSHFPGIIDEVSLLNHAMTEAEMAEFFYGLQPVTVTPSAITFSEPDGTAQFLVRLSEPPVGDVVVDLASSNMGEFTLSDDQVILDAANWETGVTVTMTAFDDGIFDGSQLASVVTSATFRTGDAISTYDPLDVKATVLDDTSGLGISSVYPALGAADKDLPATITGTGFKDATNVFLTPYPDGGDETPAASVTRVDETILSVTLPGLSEGDYTVIVRDGSGEYRFPGGVSFVGPAATAAQSRRRAIVVAGGGAYRGNLLWDAARKMTRKAYYALYSQGYSDETIQYLSLSGYEDVNGDGVNDVDAATSLDALSSAIRSLSEGPAGQLDDLILYLTGNGGAGYFEIDGRPDPKIFLSAQNLDNWLDDLQRKTGMRVIVVYDACRSGSFLPELTPPENEERILIAGADANERAWFLDDGEVSFSYKFWESIFYNPGLDTAFTQAKAAMAVMQTALLDEDGDGINDRARSGGPIWRQAADIDVGERRRRIPIEIPVIDTWSDPQALQGEIEALLEAEVTAQNGVSRVWSIILPPDCTGVSPDEPQIVPPTMNLRDTGDGRLHGNTYRKFTMKHEYPIFFHAMDRAGLSALPQTSSVTQEIGNLCVGDLNGDTLFNLADVILGLRVLAGIDVSADLIADYAGSGVDADGDGIVGMVDVLYILMMLGM